MSITNRKWFLVSMVCTLLLCGVVLADEPDKEQDKPPKPALREIRLAVFDLDITEGMKIDSKALTDQVITMLAAHPKVILVNRDQLSKVAGEHQIALSGLVDNNTAVRLGKFVNAQYVVVGRASRIGQTNYIVLRIIDIETTVQKTVAAKASAADGADAVLDRLNKPLVNNLNMLQTPRKVKDNKQLNKLRKLAKPLASKVILVHVTEKHINRPLDDPAAQMAITERLRNLGISTIVPVEPIAGWREHLLATGKYNDKKVDFLLEGEGTSGFAARLQGLTSCRARVELRLVKLPGRSATASAKDMAPGVDLVEALAAKKALEKAGSQACDALIRRAVGDMQLKSEIKNK